MALGVGTARSATASLVVGTGIDPVTSRFSAIDATSMGLSGDLGLTEIAPARRPNSGSGAQPAMPVGAHQFPPFGAHWGRGGADDVRTAGPLCYRRWDFTVTLATAENWLRGLRLKLSSPVH
jgi:hypothetical protein